MLAKKQKKNFTKKNKKRTTITVTVKTRKKITKKTN